MSSNFAPARAAVEAMAAAASPEAAALVQQALSLADLGANDNVIRAAVDAAVEAVCSYDSPSGRWDDPQVARNKFVRAYVEESFRLSCLAQLP